MNADLLREAAATMRERAEAVDTSDASSDGSISFTWAEQIRFLIVDPDATHLSTFGHPAVALAVADWLDKTATTYECVEDDLRGLEGAPTIEQVYGYDFTEAIAVARTYLGRDS